MKQKLTDNQIKMMKTIEKLKKLTKENTILKLEKDILKEDIQKLKKT